MFCPETAGILQTVWDIFSQSFAKIWYISVESWCDTNFTNIPFEKLLHTYETLFGEMCVVLFFVNIKLVTGTVQTIRDKFYERKMNDS
jgi:hypothetical protein